jgi:hypothetical protein
MLLRLYFPVIAVFFVAMNVLLWRAEFGGAGDPGSAVSEEVVWQKILTAPDDSTLEVSWNDRKIGYCRWVANVGEPVASGRTSPEDALPEGMVKQLTGYTVDLDGNIMAGNPPSRVRFALRLGFATNHVWQDLQLRVSLRPDTWEIQSVAAEEKLRLKYEGESGKWSRAFTFDELRDPRALAGELAGPLALPLLAGLAPDAQPRNLSLGLNWEAYNDWLRIGHTQVRVYRLQARLLDRYRIVAVISRVGEIMRVELPNGIVLFNEALTNL